MRPHRTGAQSTGTIRSRVDERAPGYGGRCRWAGIAASVTIALAALGGGAPATAVAADTCANSEFRTGWSATLPDCRAYELVSPADKDAYTLRMERSGGTGNMFPAFSGEAVAFSAITPFANPKTAGMNTFVATREGTGWTTRNMMPAACSPEPSSLAAEVGVTSFSVDLQTAILRHPAGDDCDPNDHGGVDVYAVAPNGTLSWVSQNGMPKTAPDSRVWEANSADASHIVFSTPEKLVLPLENGRTRGSGLYDRTGGQTVPVGLKSDGALVNPCGAQIAGESTSAGQVSAAGRVIFFTSGQSSSTPGCGIADDGGQLYARIDGTATTDVSASRLATPEARQIPKFLGATRDGSRVYFVSAERLTDEATPGGGLYVYDLSPVLAGAASTGQLTFLTPPISGTTTAVQSIVGMSDDEQTVYFSATGILAPGAPAAGNKVYRLRGGQVSYTGGFLAAGLRSTTSSVSPDGSKIALLVRSLSTRLWQVNLYDESGASVCVSCPTDGTAPTGDAVFFGPVGNGRPASLGEERYVTDDGRVYFSSRDQLDPQDTNQAYDVYEYVAGRAVLISAGTGAYDSLLVGVTGNGRDVFFVTGDSLVDQDFDEGDQDVYVARVGGGFAPPEQPARPCRGDECQPLGPAPVLSAPGSMAFASPFASPRTAPAQKSPAKRMSVKRPKAAHGTTVRLSVKVPRSGRIRVSGTGLKRTAKTARQAKTYRVTVKLSKRSVRALKRKHRVRVRATVRFTPTQGRALSTRVSITFKAKVHRGKAKRRSHAVVGKGGR